MTKTKAIEILRQHGFEVTVSTTSMSYRADILHPATGTHLHGRIYEDSLNINPTLKEYRADLWFDFGQGSSSTEFSNAVEKLEDELKHYDEILRSKRVENVRKYFKVQELKRLMRNELISSYERGEHLSREEQRELSAMGYTI